MQLLKNTTQTIQLVDTQNIYFSQYAEEIISKIKAGKILTNQQVVYSKKTIESYDYFLRTWQEFEAETGIQYNFQQIYFELISDYTNFLHKAALSKNSVSLLLSKLKFILKRAYKQRLYFDDCSGIKTPKELTTKVYLPVKELELMKNADLTKGEIKVLDIFFIQCFTGMRFETLMKFLERPEAYIKNEGEYSYIDITSGKTKEQSIIPIGDTVSNILKKYKDQNLVVSRSYINKKLKIIAEKSNVTNLVSTEITKGGVRNTELVSKNKLISTHSARRTFVSLAKQSKMTDREIMGVTGHKSERQLNEYNRTTNLEKVRGILGNDFFSKII